MAKWPCLVQGNVKLVWIAVLLYKLDNYILGSLLWKLKHHQRFAQVFLQLSYLNVPRFGVRKLVSNTFSRLNSVRRSVGNPKASWVLFHITWIRPLRRIYINQPMPNIIPKLCNNKCWKTFIEDVSTRVKIDRLFTVSNGTSDTS